MIFKPHFMRTLMLIALIILIAGIPSDGLGQSVAIIGIGLSFIVLLFLVYQYRKSLFCLITIITLLTTSPVHAGWFFSETESEAIAEQYKEKIEELGPIVCEAEDNFDEDNLEIAPDKAMMESAYELLDKYNKIGIADTGYLSTAADTLFSSLTFGLSKGLLNRYREYADCAEEYLEKTASWQKQMFESQMTTVPNILAAESGKCWPCGIASLMLESIEGVVFNLEDYLKSVALWMLGIFTLFWIALRTLIFLGKLGTASNSEYFTDLLKRLILVSIAAAFLHAPLSSFYRITLSPIIDIGAIITDTISGINTGSMGTINDKIDNSGSILGCACCSDIDSNCNDAAEKIGDRKPSTTLLLDKETRAGLMCMTCMVYKQTAPMIASGQGMMHYSLKNKHWYSVVASWVTLGLTDLLPVPFGMFVFGLLLIILFSILAFIVAFKLLDIFMQLGFVIILTPFLIAAFPFPMARQYTKKGWEFLVHAVLSVIALSLGTSLLMMVIMGILPDYTQTFLADAINAEMSDEYFEKLYDVFTGGPNGGGFFVAALLIMSILLGTCLINAGMQAVSSISGMASALPGTFFQATKMTITSAIKVAKTGARVSGALSLFAYNKIKNRKSAAASKKGSFSDTAVRKGADATANAVDKGGQFAGNLIDKGGSAAGKGLMSMGSALSSSGIGAIIGVPLVVAGAAVMAASKATGYAVKASAKGAALAIKAGARTAVATQKVARKAGQQATKIINRMRSAHAKRNNTSEMNQRQRAQRKYRR